MNTQISQAARDADALMYDAASFSSTDEGYDYSVEASWVAVPVGRSAEVRVTAEEANAARLDLVNDRGTCFATQQISGSSVAMAFMLQAALDALSVVAENSDI